MNLWYKGALELATAIREREISAVETLDLYLDRIDRFNPELNAIVVFDTEAAREQCITDHAPWPRGAGSRFGGWIGSTADRRGAA